MNAESATASPSGDCVERQRSGVVIRNPKTFEPALAHGAVSSAVATWMALLLVALMPVDGMALPADDLGLPALVTVDSDLAAAVIRDNNGKLRLIRRGDPIGPGRWRLDSVAGSSVVLVTVAADDREAGTRVRLYVEAAKMSPLIVRREAPATPMAPRLVLQTGTLKQIETDSADQSRDQP